MRNSQLMLILQEMQEVLALIKDSSKLEKIIKEMNSLSVAERAKAEQDREYMKKVDSIRSNIEAREVKLAEIDSRLKLADEVEAKNKERAAEISKRDAELKQEYADLQKQRKEFEADKASLVKEAAELEKKSITLKSMEERLSAWEKDLHDKAEKARMLLAG